MTLTDLPALAVRPRPGALLTIGLPVAVIGAGPIGLAAAARLLERGIDVVVYEAGRAAAASVREWGHVRLFSPWSMLINTAARRLLEGAGWQAPEPTALPTGDELVRRYLEPLAATPALRARIRMDTTVLAVTRQGMDRTRSARRAETPFVLRLRTADGSVVEEAAGAVIDASGTFRQPNGLGSNGLDPIGIDDVRDRIAPALPDVLGAERERFAGRRTVVAGAGHSAANTLIALAELARSAPGTEAVWVIRNARAERVTTPADDALSARTSLGARLDALVAAGAVRKVTGFEIARLEAAGGRMRILDGRGRDLEADVLVAATGFRPDLDMLREIRLDLDEVVEAPARLAPLIDPNLHSCGTVARHGVPELEQPEPDFFVAGMKSYGRAPTFLLATGYEQVRSIAARLAGDEAGARTVAPAPAAAGAPGAAATCCV